MKIVAILSTTVLPLDGTYRVKRLEGLNACNRCNIFWNGNIPCAVCSNASTHGIDITGIPHYIGHPDTKVIVESLGAVQSESKLFSGLQAGESALCFAIKQGRSTRATEGHTNPHQSVSIDDLDIRIITRANMCPYCKSDTYFHACGNCGGI